MTTEPLTASDDCPTCGHAWAHYNWCPDEGLAVHYCTRKDPHGPSECPDRKPTTRRERRATRDQHEAETRNIREALILAEYQRTGYDQTVENHGERYATAMRALTDALHEIETLENR